MKNRNRNRTSKKIIIKLNYPSESIKMEQYTTMNLKNLKTTDTKMLLYSY